jgi:hypothetical protein
VKKEKLFLMPYEDFEELGKRIPNHLAIEEKRRPA